MKNDNGQPTTEDKTACILRLETLSDHFNPQGAPDAAQVGIALEGGGSKSAPFALGVLAGMYCRRAFGRGEARERHLRRCRAGRTRQVTCSTGCTTSTRGRSTAERTSTGSDTLCVPLRRMRSTNGRFRSSSAAGFRSAASARTESALTGSTSTTGSPSRYGAIPTSSSSPATSRCGARKVHTRGGSRAPPSCCCRHSQWCQ